MSQEIAFFDSHRTGELMNRLSEDTRLMKDAGTISISMALRSAAVAILGVVLMCLKSWKLTLLTLGALPICLAAFGVFASRYLC